MGRCAFNIFSATLPGLSRKMRRHFLPSMTIPARCRPPVLECLVTLPSVRFFRLRTFYQPTIRNFERQRAVGRWHFIPCAAQPQCERGRDQARRLKDGRRGLLRAADLRAELLPLAQGILGLQVLQARIYKTSSVRKCAWRRLYRSGSRSYFLVRDSFFRSEGEIDFDVAIASEI